MMAEKNIIIARDEQATLQLGAQLAQQIHPGQLIFLNGDLGVGKTTLVRGLVHGLGYTGKIKSPSFTLVESYGFDQFMLYHVDLYRLETPEELEMLGFRDYLNENSICLIEWAEKAKDFLPKAELTINIDITGAARRISIS